MAVRRPAFSFALLATAVAFFTLGNMRLTDGHPGVSGGGVLDQRGVLVGIPICRMQGDDRFSFILPIRAETLRKAPLYEQSEAPQTAVAEQH